MGKSLKFGIISVLVANVINLVFSLITNFVLPKFLSVDSYAAIKTYQLYVSYAGAISLGYVDGMYLKYGGKNFNEIDRSDLNTNLSTLRIFQFFMTTLMVAIGCVMEDFIFIAFALTILSFNMIGYFKSLYQAIGEFGKYGRIINVTAGATFAINMVILFIAHTDNYYWYLIAYVLLNMVIWIVMEWYISVGCKQKFSYFKFYFSELFTNIKMGFLLMCGNLSSIVLTSLDQWFVKALLDTLAFAQFAFAVTMENFVNVAIAPVTITLYNYFCQNQDEKDIRKVRNYIMLFAATIVACAFPAKFILEVYLTQYLDATKVMFYLFASQIFYIIIKSIYVNLYKAQRMQTKYFWKLVLVILVGFIFNVLCFKMYPCKEAFAIGTLLSAIFWFLICYPSFKWIKYNVAEFIYPFIQTIVFLACGFLFNAIYGFVIYIILTLVISFALLKKDLFGIFKNGLSMLKKT